MTRKPIIGITLDLVEDDSRYSYASLPWYALRKNYADSVIKAGGVPLMIPYQPNSTNEIAELIDGLIIPGSDVDINPKFYGVNIVSKHTNPQFNDDKTNFELALLTKVLELNKPYLGICHGMQLLNVLFNGTLIQHIPEEIKGAIEHKRLGSQGKKVHTVDIYDDTILSRLFETNIMEINSYHHQAVGNLGKELIISAIASDGVVEAIELKNRKFAVGLQWHPEYSDSLDHERDLIVFKELIAIANALT